jgi:hypothetical protein
MAMPALRVIGDEGKPVGVEAMTTRMKPPRHGLRGGSGRQG